MLNPFPLQALLRKFDYTNRIAKWGTMLGAYDVRYILRTAIKGQVLADFVAEFTVVVLSHRKFTLMVQLTEKEQG